MPITRESHVTYKVYLASNNDPQGPGNIIGLTKFVRGWTVGKSLYGDSVGTWSLRLKVPESDDIAFFLRAYVRDDDEVQIEWSDQEGRKVMIGVVDSIGRSTAFGASDGEVSRNYTLSGREWSKFLVDGQIKMTALLGISDTYTEVAQLATEAEWYDQGTAGEVVDETTFVVSQKVPRLPGIVNVPDWQTLLEKSIQGVAAKRADIPLRQILQQILTGLYRSPYDGKTLSKRLTWQRFGEFGGVEGVPIRLPMIAGAGNVMTPHAMMQTYGCMSYNECWYDTVDNGEGEPASPAIVYRQKPFSGASYEMLKALRAKVSPDNITGENLSRSGSERFTFWRPITLVSELNGIAIMLKAGDYTLPFVDRADLDVHGLRPAEPADNFFPVFDAPDKDYIAFTAARLARYRKWMKLAPEYVSGTVQVAPALPAVKIGTMIELPIAYEFFYKAAGEKKKSVHVADSLLAYVVGTEDRYTVDDNGGVTSSGTISVIRGEPADGSMKAPGISPYWYIDVETDGFPSGTNTGEG